MANPAASAVKDSPGKTALVTGTSTGIGRDLAEIFAHDGHHLVITARNDSLLQDLANELRDQYHVNVDVIVQDLSAPTRRSGFSSNCKPGGSIIWEQRGLRHAWPVRGIGSPDGTGDVAGEHGRAYAFDAVIFAADASAPAAGGS